MKVLRFVGIGLALLLLSALGFYAWASHTASRKLSRTYSIHTVSFPIPFPLGTAYHAPGPESAADVPDGEAVTEPVRRADDYDLVAHGQLIGISQLGR